MGHWVMVLLFACIAHYNIALAMVLRATPTSTTTDTSATPHHAPSPHYAVAHELTMPTWSRAQSRLESIRYDGYMRSHGI